MSIGSSGVSFWGGTGADSFSFGYISNAAGPAYFWNDQVGIDTIVFDASAATNTNNFQFGVTGNSGIQFTLDDAYTSAFSSIGISGAFATWPDRQKTRPRCSLPLQSPLISQTVRA